MAPTCIAAAAATARRTVGIGVVLDSLNVEEGRLANLARDRPARVWAASGGSGGGSRSGRKMQRESYVAVVVRGGGGGGGAAAVSPSNFQLPLNEDQRTRQPSGYGRTDGRKDGRKDGHRPPPPPTDKSEQARERERAASSAAPRRRLTASILVSRKTAATLTPFGQTDCHTDCIF